MICIRKRISLEREFVYALNIAVLSPEVTTTGPGSVQQTESLIKLYNVYNGRRIGGCPDKSLGREIRK